MQNLTGYIFLLLAVILVVMLMTKKKVTTVNTPPEPGPMSFSNPFDAWYAANVAPTHGAYSTVS